MSDAVSSGRAAPEQAAKLRKRMHRAIEISEQMLDAAASGEWEQLAALQAERATWLEGGFSPAQTNLAPALQVGLGKLSELNDRLVALATAERDAHGTRLGRVAVGRRAGDAYTSTGA